MDVHIPIIINHYGLVKQKEKRAGRGAVGAVRVGTHKITLQFESAPDAREGSRHGLPGVVVQYLPFLAAMDLTVKNLMPGIFA